MPEGVRRGGRRKQAGRVLHELSRVEHELSRVEREAMRELSML